MNLFFLIVSLLVSIHSGSGVGLQTLPAEGHRGNPAGPERIFVKKQRHPLAATPVCIKLVLFDQILVCSLVFSAELI